MGWQVELTQGIERWFNALDPVKAERFAGILDRLEQRGPALGRPTVDSIKGSRHHNMKELRSGTLRALFAFDSQRRAVVLVAGDKRNDWRGWYQRNIPVADRLFDEHLRGIGGGEQRWRERGNGGRSAESDR